MYLLNEVARDLLRYGLPRLRSELDAQSAMLYDYFDQHPSYTPLVAAPEHRSATTLVIETPAGSKPVMDALSAKGMKIGSGYGKHAGSHIRIANFPAHLGHTQTLLDLLQQQSA